MKEITKINKLYKGLVGSAIKPLEDQLIHRKEVCANCIYNSVNNTDMGLIDTLRFKSGGKPFCTECKCNIKEKTESTLEGCPIGKWNKLRIETFKKEVMNITNISNLDVEIKLQDYDFIVDFGEVNREDDLNIGLMTDVESPNKLQITEIELTCGCTQAQFTHLTDQKTTVSLRLLINNLTDSSAFSKNIYINHSVNGINRVQKVILKGFKK